MKFSFSSNIDKIVSDMKKDVDLSKSSMHTIGNAINKSIQKRLDSGKDINGSKFVAYSDFTKKAKAKKGKSSSVVNLKDTGKMRNSIRITSKENELSLEVVGERKKVAEYHQSGTKNLDQREWFGLTDKDVDDIADNISKQIFNNLTR